MTITAQSADGVLHQFPDGTPSDVIDNAMQTYAKSPPADNGGILKNIGAGAAGALTGLAGTVVNALNPVSHIQGILHPSTYIANQRMQDMSETGDSVTHAANSVLGPIDPEKVTANTFPERLARGVGAGFTGALIPSGGAMTVGSMLKNAAIGAISGAGAAAGAQIAPERYKPLGAVAGGVVAPMGAVGMLNALKTGTSASEIANLPVPTMKDLTSAKKAAYSLVDNSPMNIAKPAVQSLYDQAKSSLERMGLNDNTIGRLAPKASAALDALQNAAKSNQTLQGMEVQRRIAGIAADSIDKTDRAAARIIQDHIDDFVQNLGPEHLSGPIDQGAIDALPIARSLAQRSFKAQTIQGIIDKANTNSSTFSASGLENALRSGFRKLANNDRGISRFNPDEQAAIRQVATGGSPLSASNVLRYVGKLSPQGAIPMLAEGAGVLTGGPAMLAVPAVGAAARLGATVLTKRAAQNAMNVVSRGPVASDATVGDFLRRATSGGAQRIVQ